MKYDLVGIDGNAYSVMGYTARALRNEGLGNLVDEMLEKAKSSDYYNLIAVCLKYIDRANEAYENRANEEDEEDEF